MFSIEGDVQNSDKYEFNRPLSCIDVKFGMANEILPTIEYDGPTIIWLDYDGMLEDSCLEDLNTVVSKVDDGSVVLISYNSRPLKTGRLPGYVEGCDERALLKNYVHSKISAKYINHGESFRGLGRWDRYSSFLRETVLNALKSSIALRNRDLLDGEKFVMKQMFNFNYRDGVEMSTLGFVVHKESSEQSFLKCQFSDFEFYRPGSDHYEIQVPMLTSKEVKTLVEIMPVGKTPIRAIKKLLPAKVFKDADILNFSKIYKYNPMFNDSEMT